LRAVQFGEDRFARIAGAGEIARTGSEAESVEGDKQAWVGKHGKPIDCAPTRAIQAPKS
jgi:hypothetical protein